MPDHPASPPGPAAPTVVVFDVGEVLIDETRVWAVWAELIGVSPLTFATVLGAAIVQGEDHTAVFPHVAPNVDWELLEADHEQRYGGFTEEDLYPDARGAIEELRQMGIVVGIIGNQPARRREQLEALALGADFLATSGDLGVEKPDPAFFSAVLEAAGGVPAASVLYVGDRLDNDVIPAESAGFRTCWLQRGPWGQLQEAPEDVEPDLVLEGLAELPTLLAQWRDQTEDSEHG